MRLRIRGKRVDRHIALLDQFGQLVGTAECRGDRDRSSSGSRPTGVPPSHRGSHWHWSHPRLRVVESDATLHAVVRWALRM